jgi:pimeloyl-ACP methyl ester carboxylesterase
MPASSVKSQPVAGTAMEAQVEGTGLPLALLGGGTTGSAALAPHAAKLATAHRVARLQSINIQYASEGRPLPNDYTVAFESRAMQRGLDASGLTGSVDVFGWSYGGLIALDFALNHPERIRSLALAEPPAFWLLGGDEPVDETSREMLAILRGLGRSEISEEQVERYRCALGNCPAGRSIRVDPRWQTWLKERDRLRGLAAVALHQDDRSRLRTFQRPVLILTGTTTVSFHRRINDILAKDLPSTQRAELPGGHGAVVTAMDSFLQIYSGFLSSRL